MIKCVTYAMTNIYKDLKYRKIMNKYLFVILDIENIFRNIYSNAQQTKQ